MTDGPPTLTGELRHLSVRARIRLESIAHRRRLETGAWVVREGEPDRDLYQVESGSLEVLKRSAANDGLHRIEVLEPGDFFGELALFDDRPRSASVRALEESSVTVYPAAELEALPPEALNETLWELAARAGEKVRRGSVGLVRSLERQLELERARVEAAGFLTSVILLLCLYAIILKIAGLTGIGGGLVSAPVITVVSLWVLFSIRRNPRPAAHFGLTLGGWRRSLVDATVWTLGLMVVMTLVKGLLVATVPALEGQPVVLDLATLPTKRLAYMGLYCLLAPFQEVIVRGALQGSLEEILVGERRRGLAVLVSNVLFAAVHLHLGLAYGATVFLPGLFWGWLYTRHRSLVGVSVSHALVGAYGLFLLGLGPVLRMLP